MPEEHEQQSDLKKGEAVPQCPLSKEVIQRATDWVSEPKTVQLPREEAPGEVTGVSAPWKLSCGDLPA